MGLPPGRRLSGRVVTDQPDNGEGKGNGCQEYPARRVARVREEVTEQNGNEEASYGRQREHQPRCRADVRMIDVTDPCRHRQPRGESEDQEETDPDAQDPERPSRYCWNQGQEDGDDQKRANDECSQVLAAVGPVAAQ